MDTGLEGRVAIVTGGSRGIGHAVAAQLVAEGADVVVVGRDERALARVVDELGAGQALAVAADLTDPAAADRVVDACRERFGGPDVLVNNAGGATPSPIAELGEQDWHDAFEQNFFSAVRMSAACAPLMAEAGWGRIVHVASVSAREPDPAFAPYSAAKAALVNLSGSLARAWGPRGVRSSCVLAGITMTGLVERNVEDVARARDTTPEEVLARLLRRQDVPAGRFGEPGDVAAAVVFLASAAAEWVNGATLEVDGGTLRSV